MNPFAMYAEDATLRAQMAKEPSPFTPMPVAVAERRLGQARYLAEVFAGTLRVLLETNNVEDHQNYYGEGVLNDTLIALADEVRALLGTAHMQLRAATARDTIDSALAAFDFIDTNADECSAIAHREVLQMVEDHIGPLADVIERVDRVMDTARRAAATPPVEA